MNDLCPKPIILENIVKNTLCYIDNKPRSFVHAPQTEANIDLNKKNINGLLKHDYLFIANFPSVCLKIDKFIEIIKYLSFSKIKLIYLKKENFNSEQWKLLNINKFKNIKLVREMILNERNTNISKMSEILHTINRYPELKKEAQINIGTSEVSRCNVNDNESCVFDGNVRTQNTVINIIQQVEILGMEYFLLKMLETDWEKMQNTHTYNIMPADFYFQTNIPSRNAHLNENTGNESQNTDLIIELTTQLMNDALTRGIKKQVNKFNIHKITNNMSKDVIQLDKFKNSLLKLNNVLTDDKFFKEKGKSSKLKRKQLPSSLFQIFNKNTFTPLKQTILDISCLIYLEKHNADLLNENKFLNDVKNMYINLVNNMRTDFLMFISYLIKNNKAAARAILPFKCINQKINTMENALNMLNNILTYGFLIFDLNVNNTETNL
ncbi:hypothetical protein SGHV070 [Glossina pallidipes salivary gland hypertrophy virus]|uniref:Uncharacterized protein n=1 Tax=Glossina hytrovirus (isolate Glossina pallidipes/Ethiopia/Seibersdorf/-) TaxID=379529 RepID=B0YLM4_GHVS|nr:hypothetical protein SGHV070 [Glossina pallidipes salivary gland hypertrophy virus]ABQ08843.1 hypothetical protein SGHV070 [Glossina pallidipes salivary gland hypertrophy virus]